MNSVIQELYKVQNQISDLSDDEVITFNNLYNLRYDFSNEKLQKEIGVEKIKDLFLQFIKKTKKFSRMDSLLFKKFLSISKNENRQLQDVFIQNFDDVKHLITDVTDNKTTITLKIIYLYENNILTLTQIENDIDYVKSITNLSNEHNKIDKILRIINKNKVYKRSTKKGIKRNQKVTEEKGITIRTKNKIFKYILEIKEEIFKEEVEEEYINYDKEVEMILKKFNKKDNKHHIYVNSPTCEKNQKIEAYLDFLFNLKEKSDGKIDDIIDNSFYSFFDEYHTHFDYMFANELPFNRLPFKYDDGDNIVVVKATFVTYLTNMKNYHRIFEIIDYFINYLNDRDYIKKFRETNIEFYFANFLGFLKCVGYKKKNPILTEIFNVFQNDKLKKQIQIKDNKLKFFKKYNKYLDIENIDFKDIPKSEDGLHIMDILLLLNKMKLKEHLKKLYTNERKYSKYLQILEHKCIVTFDQYKRSKYYREVKVEEVKETVVVKEKKLDIKQLMNYKINSTTTPINIEQPVISYKQKIENLQKDLDIINFKSLYGIVVEGKEETKEKLEKMILQLDTNNQNIIMSNSMESQIKIMETKMNSLTNDVEKTKMKRKIQSMINEMNRYKKEIRNLDENGYEYGTNYEKDIPNKSNTYISSEIINKAKRMQDVMAMIEVIDKKKNGNRFLNNFVINISNSYETTNQKLFDIYDLFMNHKIDTIFEKFCQKNYKQIKDNLKEITMNKTLMKKLSQDYGSLATIIFFILQNQDHINKYYKEQNTTSQVNYLNKFIKYQDKIGKVILQNENKLHIQFDTDIEILDASFVTMVPSFEQQEVFICGKTIYKGCLGIVKKQVGDTVFVYPYDRKKVISVNIKNIKLVPQYKNIIVNGQTLRMILPKQQKSTIIQPKNVENKDLYSISRFLYNFIINTDKKPNDLYFNKLYSIVLKHVNEIIIDNESKLKVLQKLKKENNKCTKTHHCSCYFCTKNKYERNGLLKMDFNDSVFRTKKQNGISVLKDNAEDYLKEDVKEKQFQVIIKSPEELQMESEKQDEIIKENFIIKTKNIMDSFNNINLSF
jgi:hypothetical protein